MFLFDNIPLGGMLEVMKKIIDRLSRIEGQIRGLQKMLQDPKDCEQVITQFLATKSALENCFAVLLEQNLQQCLKDQDPKKTEKILKLIAKT